MLQSSSLFPNYRSGAFVNRDSGQLIDPRAELPVVLRILGKFAREDEAFASPPPWAVAHCMWKRGLGHYQAVGE